VVIAEIDRHMELSAMEAHKNKTPTKIQRHRISRTMGSEDEEVVVSDRSWR